MIRHPIMLPVETESISLEIELTTPCWDHKCNNGCEFCDGKGYILTDAGEAIMDMIQLAKLTEDEQETIDNGIP